MFKNIIRVFCFLRNSSVKEFIGIYNTHIIKYNKIYMYYNKIYSTVNKKDKTILYL